MKIRVIVGGLLFALSMTANAAIISFSLAGPYTVDGGGTLSVDVVVSELGGEIVSGFDIDIEYDPGILSVAGITQHEVLGDSSLFDALYDPDPDGLFCLSPASGCLSIFGVSLLDDLSIAGLQNGASVILATLDFNVIGMGSDIVTDLAFFLDVSLGKDVKGFGNQVIVPATSVPEPGSLALLGIGLLALLSGRLRPRSNAAA